MCVCFFPHTPILHQHRSVQDHIDFVSTVPVGSFWPYLESEESEKFSSESTLSFGNRRSLEQGHDGRGSCIWCLGDFCRAKMAFSLRHLTLLGGIHICCKGWGFIQCLHFCLWLHSLVGVQIHAIGTQEPENAGAATKPIRNLPNRLCSSIIIGEQPVHRLTSHLDCWARLHDRLKVAL